MSPAQVIAKLRADAASPVWASHGFSDDPNKPNGSRYYGYLVNPSGY